MTDSGLVVTTAGDLAEVQVDCFVGCRDCAAKDLCIGNKKTAGRLSVKNPLHAHPGDRVKIRIPENQYSHALILLFGGLLAAALLGMGGGYMLGTIFSLPGSMAGPIGLAVGLVSGGFAIGLLFRQKNKEQLYPVITDIIQKGECYGSA
jgi:hypothetical protein